MYINRYILRKLCLLALALTAILLTFQPAQDSASANGAPPPPVKGSDIHPSAGNTNVRMMSEFVIIDIPVSSDEPDWHAEVTATFYMKNIGEETEEMFVRFPMFHNGYNLNWETTYEEEYCEFESNNFRPIEDILITINNIEVSNEISFKDFIYKEYNNGEYIEKSITMPCWSHFDVSFPPNEVVEIKVTYTVAGYDLKYNTAVFSYVVTTGEGWFDTIGESTIIARLPYEVNEYNFISCHPDDCILEGSEIIWHYENFVPESDIYVSVLKPYLWLNILEAKEKVKEFPNDGHAWGALGTAYREAMRTNYGYLDTKDTPLFQLGIDSYNQALELLPEDPNLRIGFAEIICNAAIIYEPQVPLEECEVEIRKVFELEPENQEAVELIQKYNLDERIPELIAFLPSPTPSATIFMTPSSTPTITATSLLLPSNTPEPEQPLIVTQALPPAVQVSTPSPVLLISGAGVMIIIIVGLVWLARRHT